MIPIISPISPILAQKISVIGDIEIDTDIGHPSVNIM